MVKVISLILHLELLQLLYQLGSAGAIVAIADYAGTFQTNNLTISPNGSEKIGGVSGDLVAAVEGQALTLVYVDGTEGWINVQNAENTVDRYTTFYSSDRWYNYYLWRLQNSYFYRTRNFYSFINSSRTFRKPQCCRLFSCCWWWW